MATARTARRAPSSTSSGHDSDGETEQFSAKEKEVIAIGVRLWSVSKELAGCFKDLVTWLLTEGPTFIVERLGLRDPRTQRKLRRYVRRLGIRFGIVRIPAQKEGTGFMDALDAAEVPQTPRSGNPSGHVVRRQLPVDFPPPRRRVVPGTQAKPRAPRELARPPPASLENQLRALTQQLAALQAAAAAQAASSGAPAAAAPPAAPAPSPFAALAGLAAAANAQAAAASKPAVLPWESPRRPWSTRRRRPSPPRPPLSLRRPRGGGRRRQRRRRRRRHRGPAKAAAPAPAAGPSESAVAAAVAEPQARAEPKLTAKQRAAAEKEKAARSLAAALASSSSDS
eukprot:tig00000989_g6110.t1